MNSTLYDYYPAWRSANGGDDYAIWLWGQWHRAERHGRTEEAARLKSLYRAEDLRLRR